MHAGITTTLADSRTYEGPQSVHICHRKFSDSLETYGHEPIQLVFTDNPRGDKAELERLIPSLRKEVILVPNNSSLPKFETPDDWSLIKLSTAYQVTTRLKSILDDVAGLPLSL
ncbi:hypothetical protein HGRIS_001160 [Hohenbuehelia grisea]|uniref:Uncharacterized protein n=1 Tax=Hohenbuehelia grisea TaxID=104357 RepID=A0ABR3JQN2_9AGAR